MTRLVEEEEEEGSVMEKLVMNNREEQEQQQKEKTKEKESEEQSTKRHVARVVEVVRERYKSRREDRREDKEGEEIESMRTDRLFAAKADGSEGVPTCSLSVDPRLPEDALNSKIRCPYLQVIPPPSQNRGRSGDESRGSVYVLRSAVMECGSSIRQKKNVSERF
jgi:hypothetical protein